MPTASRGAGAIVALASPVATGRQVRHKPPGGGGGRNVAGSGEGTAGQGLERVVPSSEPSAVASAACLKRGGVRQQRGQDASGAASQPDSADAGSEAAVLQLSDLQGRQT